MLVFNSPTDIKLMKLKNTTCAIGVFDGIHTGHQKIIGSMVRDTKKNRGTSIIITFDKHPYTALDPSYNIPILTTTDKKLELLDSLGVDVCILMKFNKSTASISAENWIKDILWNKLSIENIYIGEDSFFGKNRQGNIDTLREWGIQLGFNVKVIKKTRIDKVVVSSTSIRDYISNGNIEMAEKLLGRPYSIIGMVIKGKGTGGKLGFPTANFNIGNQCLPPQGVYAVKAKIGSRTVPAVANIGIRPTLTRSRKPILEVHLLEHPPLGKSLYKKELEIIFIKRIRDEKKFTNSDLLIQQIEKDVTHAKQILKK